jgi:hypothetical protein
MTGTREPHDGDAFTPPLPHDPPPPPGYVDPLEDAEVLADLDALITGPSTRADEPPAAPT